MRTMDFLDQGIQFQNISYIFSMIYDKNCILILLINTNIKYETITLQLTA